MERLTKRNLDGTIGVNELRYYNYNDFQKIIQKLAQYEDLEEQDRLIRLPCKVGDVIWDNDYGVPTAYEITGYSFGESDGYIEYPASKTEIVFYFSNTSGSITGSFASNEIGKSVFLSLEEAEQALKESK